MNSDQITGIIRALVPALLAYFVGKGWIPGSSVPDITAAVVAILAALWSVFSNTTSHKLSSSVDEPGAVDAAKTMAPTAQVVAVANALKERPSTVAPDKTLGK
jgi:hypothetical protein